MIQQQAVGKGLIVLLVAVAVVVLAAGGAMAASITHAVDPEHGAAYITYVTNKAKEFYQETGHQVNIINVSGQRTQIAVWAAANSLPDAVDVVSDNAYSYFEQGMFADLRPYFSRPAAGSRVLDDFLPLSLVAFTAPEKSSSPGAIFAYPWNVLHFIGAYNTELMARSGLTPPNELGEEWNWETMRQYAGKLSVQAAQVSQKRYGIQIPKVWHRWGVYFRHAGNPIFNRDIDPDQVNLNTTAALNTLRFLVSMREEEHLTWDNWVFNQGQAAISFNANPNFALTMKNYNITIDFIPFAYGPDGANGVEVQAAGVAMNKKTTNPDLVWQWLNYLWGDYEHIVEFIETTSRIPVLKRAQTDFLNISKSWAPHAHLIIEGLAGKGTGLRPVVRAGGVVGIVENWIHQAMDLKVMPADALYQAHHLANEALKEDWARR
ncbi:MAG TPA: extracellular solute-binding protein [Firmicutes bacterium]|nr:extracellular solute-binding protein [Bacillota bacterium]